MKSNLCMIEGSDDDNKNSLVAVGNKDVNKIMKPLSQLSCTCLMKGDQYIFQ